MVLLYSTDFFECYSVEKLFFRLMSIFIVLFSIVFFLIFISQAQAMNQVIRI